MKRDRGKGDTADCAGDADGKGKIWAPEPDSGMDELFAVLGYKVKSSDMADVAEKLEQLEMAMGNTTVMEDGDGGCFGVSAASVLCTDTIHYNPSDLSGWIESMLNSYDAINPAPITIPDESPAPAAPTDVVDDDDLRAIPRQAILKIDSDNDSPNWTHKRMKPSPGSEFGAPPPRPVVVLDSQETGVRLVHTLMACAEAIQKDNMSLADALVKHVGALAVSQIGAMRKVATYFAEALARKIYNIRPPVDSLPSDDLQMHFFETAPYFKFAHFTTNRAIFEAFTAAPKVHVIDFSLKQGIQWPALLQALAGRPAGAPEVRLTGVGIKPDTEAGLNQVGQMLHHFAELIGIKKFEFRGIVIDSLADFNPNKLEIRNDETLAINSVFELHQLLARPGAIDHFLTTIKSMSPDVVTIVEQEANHNVDTFLDRFNSALHYYSTMFDSLESGCTVEAGGENLVLSEMYLGWQICNVVACEGEERVERHETLEQWRRRMYRAGFEAAHLGSSAFKEVSRLLESTTSGGYGVEEKDGCLMLGWHTRPLIATSAWRLPRN